METGKVIGVAVCDGHQVTRHGIKDIVNSLGHYEVTAEASCGDELLRCLALLHDKPELCVLDITNSGRSRQLLLKELKRSFPALKILVLSFFYDEYIILDVLRNGANGFLGKDCTTRQLVQALAAVYYTDYYYSPSITRKVFDLQQNKQSLPRITDREHEFLTYCCSELNYREIADRMGISARTVEAFRNTLFSKLNIKTRMGLILFAIHNGLVVLGDLPV